MDPQERAREVEDEDVPLSPEQLASFCAGLEQIRATHGFTTGHNASPEADARRRFFEDLDADDV